jgi:hypothetical protein
MSRAFIVLVNFSRFLMFCDVFITLNAELRGNQRGIMRN